MAQNFERRSKINSTRLPAGARSGLVDAMQSKLFYRSYHKPTPKNLAQLLSRLNDDDGLAQFNIFVVGSVIYNPSQCRDVDLVLTPQTGERLTISEIERALISCVDLGWRESRICVDPVYRRALQTGGVTETTRHHGLKLEGPDHTYWFEVGDVRCIKPVGDYLVEVNRNVIDCPYFGKLPVVDSKKRNPWLSIGELSRLIALHSDRWPESYA